jgi:hypothetical protein
MSVARSHFHFHAGWLLVFSLLVGAWSLGCSPEIGDACTSSSKCSAKGDRLCDSTQPDGYCTVFNCEPGGCPDEAICVAFNETSCANVARSGRITRTFCMAGCDDNGDCRDGYYCKEIGADDPAMQIVDTEPAKRRICTVVPNGVQASVISNDAGICGPGDGSLPPVEAPAQDASPEADAPADGQDEDGLVSPADAFDQQDGADAPADASDASATD